MVLLALLGAPRPSAAGEASPLDFLGPFLDIGVSGGIKYFRVNGPDDTFGSFQSLALMPSLRVGSSLFVFPWKEYTCGVNIVANATYFSMDRQVPVGDIWEPTGGDDVGTDVKGYAVYLIPNLLFVGPKEKSRWVDETRVGLGVGPGYLRAKGSILLDHTQEEDTVVQDPVRRTLDVNRFTAAFSLFIEARRGHWTYSLLVAGPITQGTYEAEYMDVALTASYSWYRAKRAP